MTYPAENFYPAIEPRRSSPGTRSDADRAFDVASRKAAAAIERTRLAAGSLVETYDHWRRVRETIRQLSLLDDAALRDIGLHRGQIPGVARDHALKTQREAVQRVYSRR